jgi:hypothetical protein
LKFGGREEAHSGGSLVSLQHPDPIGEGLAMEAFAEAAGPECIVPGQQAPLRLMGLKVHLAPSMSEIPP